MLEQLIAYIPQDRIRALTEQQSLPLKAQGTALFADISGFTTLTEHLRQTLGAHRGAEVLTQQLNMVYTTLITEIHRYGGSVLVFSGDAITCWFDGDPSQTASQALQVAVNLQEKMKPLHDMHLTEGIDISLHIKVALATGSASRVVVGDPAHRVYDVLAGATLLRMAQAETLANRDEILLDMPTVAIVNNRVEVAELRSANNHEFGVLERLTEMVSPPHLPSVDITRLTIADIRPWLHASIVEQIQQELNEFMTELRPAVALFLYFDGLDFETDVDAPAQLDEFIRFVQTTLARYEGVLLQITVGDKGSYLHISFGSLIVHEDDSQRAVRAAIDLLKKPSHLSFAMQIGISRGIMRTGAYGSLTRRTYGAQGDETNFAARLMQLAQDGDIVVSERIYQDVQSSFDWEALPSVQLKGKSDTITPFRLVSEHMMNRPMSRYSLPCIGRDFEIEQVLQRVQSSSSSDFNGLILIDGEAGIGKTRLLYEVRQQVEQQGMVWLSGIADQVTPRQLEPFNHLLVTYFDQQRNESPAQNYQHFTEKLTTLQNSLNDKLLAEDLAQAQPFLSALLNHEPTGDLYRQLEPDLRYENTLNALKSFILALAMQHPLILHLDDAQWFDAGTWDALQLILRSVDDAPLTIILTGRPEFVASNPPNADNKTLNIHLQRLTAQSVAEIAAHILEGEACSDLLKFLEEKTDGNPFFTEQMLRHLQEENYLGIDKNQQWRLKSEMSTVIPDALNQLLIARLDRLGSQVKTTIKAAAVLGQEFEVNILRQMLQTDVNLSMQTASQATIWTQIALLRYLFTHALLRDAAYELQVSQQLKNLHLLAAESISTLYADNLTNHYADLAYHYRQGEDVPHEIEFTQHAAQQAREQYANTAAIQYYQRLLTLWDDNEYEARFTYHQELEALFNHLGQRAAQLPELDALTTLAEQLADAEKQIDTLNRRMIYLLDTGDTQKAHDLFTAFQAEPPSQGGFYYAKILLTGGMIYQNRGEFDPSTQLFKQALSVAIRLGNAKLALNIEIQIIYNMGQAYQLEAIPPLAESALKRAQQLNDPVLLAKAYNALATYDHYNNNPAQANPYYQQAAEYCRQAGWRRGLSVALSNQITMHRMLGEVEQGLQLATQQLQISREIGDKGMIASANLSFGELSFIQGEYAAAESYDLQALALFHETGERDWVIDCLNHLSFVYMTQSKPESAMRVLQEGQAIAIEIGDQWGEAMTTINLTAASIDAVSVDETLSNLKKSLELVREVGVTELYREGVVILLKILNKQADYVRGAELLGYLRLEPDEVFDNSYRKLDIAQATVRQNLSTEQFDAQFERGEKLDIEDLITQVIAGDYI